MKKPTASKKWKIYAVILALTTLVGTAASVLPTVIAHPTEQHRENTRQLEELNTKAWAAPDKTVDTFTSKEYLALMDNSYGRYSYGLGLFAGMALLVGLNIAIIVATYRYLRSKRVTSKVVRAVVIINVAAGLLALLPILLFEKWYLGTRVAGLGSPFAGPTELIVSIVTALTLGTLVTYLVTKVVEWHYNRSHSFDLD